MLRHFESGRTIKLRFEEEASIQRRSYNILSVTIREYCVIPKRLLQVAVSFYAYDRSACVLLSGETNRYKTESTEPQRLLPN